MTQDTPIEVEDRRRRGYYTVDNVLLDIYGKTLGPHGIAVYNALARFANKDDECWPSYRAITDRTGVSRSQVIREVAKMEGLKIIEVQRRVDEKGNRQSHLYILLNIVGGGSTQESGGGSYLEPGSTTQEPKQSRRKNISTKKVKKEKLSYRPAEYADIILG